MGAGIDGGVIVGTLIEVGVTTLAVGRLIAGLPTERLLGDGRLKVGLPIEGLLTDEKLTDEMLNVGTLTVDTLIDDGVTDGTFTAGTLVEGRTELEWVNVEKLSGGKGVVKVD